MSVAIEDILESVLDEVCRTRGQLPRILFVRGAPRIGRNQAGDVVFSAPPNRRKKVQEQLTDDGLELDRASGFWTKTIY